jgi:hypothetical protein
MEMTPELKNKTRWVLFFKSFCFLLVTAAIAAFVLFFGLKFLQRNDLYHAPVQVVIGPWSRYNLWEIAEHPFTYLLSISSIYALLGSLWIATIAPKHRRHQNLQALLIPWAAVILTSPFWGLIWSIYRWPPQLFSDSSTMLIFYRHDIEVGLILGWLSAIFSFPINILSYVVSYILLLISKKLFLR